LRAKQRTWYPASSNLGIRRLAIYPVEPVTRIRREVKEVSFIFHLSPQKEE
jgi:hypothetical protein